MSGSRGRPVGASRAHQVFCQIQPPGEMRWLCQPPLHTNRVGAPRLVAGVPSEVCISMPLERVCVTTGHLGLDVPG
eukprot:2426464-Amphidinium_carterae.1